MKLRRPHSAARVGHSSNSHSLARVTRRSSSPVCCDEVRKGIVDPELGPDLPRGVALLTPDFVRTSHGALDGAILNELWDGWLPAGHPPVRAMVQVGLGRTCKVEMVVTAAVPDA